MFLPAGVDDATFRKGTASRGVVVAGCLGALAGKAFRLGHMGNIGAGEVAKTLQAIEESLRELGLRVTPGTAVAAAAGPLAHPEERSGSRTGLRGAPPCMMHLGYGVRRRGLPVEVRHVSQVLDEAYEGAATP